MREVGMQSNAADTGLFARWQLSSSKSNYGCDWITCCVPLSRKEEQNDEEARFRTPQVSARGPVKEIVEDDDLNDFYDCVDSLEELEQYEADRELMAAKTAQGSAAAGSHKHDDHARLHRDGASKADESRHSGCGDCADFNAVMAVLNRAREEFCRRMQEWSDDIFDLTKGCPELEWATPDAARRMLKASIGDIQKAVQMMVRALEIRARDRELFQSMRCEQRSDMRVIAYDLEEHPVVYTCAKSQNGDLRSLRDQIVVTFEAACKLANAEGRVVFIFDMHGLKPHLNMDLEALRDLADILGTVFAERIARITVVDFSRAAQTMWWLLKPLLSRETREKFAFVNAAEAHRKLRDQFAEEAFERITTTMDVNRDPRLSLEDREAHAADTAVWRPRKA